MLVKAPLKCELKLKVRKNWSGEIAFSKYFIFNKDMKKKKKRFQEKTWKNPITRKKGIRNKYSA